MKPESEIDDQNGTIPEACREKDFWNRIRNEISIGQSVTGTVICRRPFGVFLDIGYGTDAPALLLVPEFTDAKITRIEYDDYPELGEPVNAWIIRVDWEHQKIALTQNQSSVSALET